jgi:endonuclease/exonuclease/phosphatase family metal-dependent hydrolase
MRLATFNLLHGMPVLGVSRNGDRPQPGAWPQFDGALLAEAFRLLDADVVGLQEVDACQPRSGRSDQPRLVAEAMGAEHGVFVPTVEGTPGEPGWAEAPASAAVVHSPSSWQQMQASNDEVPHYGVALISRFPILEWEAIRFPAAGMALPLLVPGDPRPQVVRVQDEPRAAIAAVVESPHGPMTVVTAHLSFVPGTNASQLRSLVRQLAHLPRPLVLMGDLNLPGRLPRWLTGWQSLARGATYPSMRPVIQFDHLLADGLPPSVRPVVAGHRLPISDHLALSATFPPPR